MSNYKYALDENKELVLTKNNDPLLSDSEGSESIIGDPVDDIPQEPSLERITEESPSIQQEFPSTLPTIQTPTSNSQMTPINSLSDLHPDLQQSEQESEPQQQESESGSEQEFQPQQNESGSEQEFQPQQQPEPQQQQEFEPQQQSESEQEFEPQQQISEQEFQQTESEQEFEPKQQDSVLFVSQVSGDDSGDAYNTQNLPDFLDFIGHLDETSTVEQVDALGQSNFRGTIVENFPLEWIIYVVSFQKEHNSKVVGHLINWMFYMLTRSQINELINPIPDSYIASLMDTFGIKFNYNNE